MSSQFGDGGDVGGFLSIRMQREALWDLPYENLLPAVSAFCDQSTRVGQRTLPSSEAEAINESLKGLLHYCESCAS